MDARRAGQGPLQRAWLALERALDRIFPAGGNPLAHLGALACLLFAALLVSGIYLYVAFDTSVGGAWASIDALSRAQPLAGGWLRSLHRYAADAFVLVTLLHLLREWVLGRYTGFRRYTWLTGVPLLVLAYVSGIGGFWLNWDQLGQYSAMASAEMLDALPLFAAPLTRNFIDPAAVDDRLFSLLVFIHLGVPLLLLFGLWFHLQRISRPEVWPPRALALGFGGTLALLALAVPVHSQAPADLAVAPAALAYDWILLHLHPLAQAGGAGVAWALVAGVLGSCCCCRCAAARRRLPVAVVDAGNCNGCRRCVDDCPYSAITLEPHPNGRRGRQIAVVAADRCASCGICVGSCPSSTPFRSTQALVTGIDMPQWPIDALRQRLQQALARAGGARRIVVYGCDHGADLRALARDDVAGFSLACTGMLPPAFIEYALRGGAAGVVVATCRADACEFRLGARWTAQRLAREREPRLRDVVPAARLRLVQAGPGDESVLLAAVEAMAAGTAAAAATPATGARAAR